MIEVEKHSQVDGNYGFVIIDINGFVASAASRLRQDGFSGNFRSKAPQSEIRIAVGDTLQISIIEIGSGIFGQSNNAATLGAETASAQATPLQPIVVAQDGYINVPFAREIQAAGRTPEDLRLEIEHLLAKKALTPQVEVSVLATGGNIATVGGEVYRPAVFPLALYGTKLLDVIAEAGGARFPVYETNVHLTRRGETAIVPLQSIIDNPRQNIYIQPRDQIYLTHDPRTFTAFGATSKVGHYAFESVHLTLAEAVAKAGGFVNGTADPAGAFLFRFEPAKFVAYVHPELAGTLTPLVPVIYRLNLRQGDGYFDAQRFPVRDKDVIMIADAQGAELLKFFTLVRGATGIISDFKSNTVTTSSQTGSF